MFSRSFHKRGRAALEELLDILGRLDIANNMSATSAKRPRLVLTKLLLLLPVVVNRRNATIIPRNEKKRGELHHTWMLSMSST
jgi:hypothetical protein